MPNDSNRVPPRPGAGDTDRASCGAMPIPTVLFAQGVRR